MTEPQDPMRRSARWEVAHQQATTGAWQERRRLAAAMRRVIEGLVVSDAPQDELARAADALERYAERLASHPRRQLYQGWAETSPAGDAASFFDQSPLIGLANPLSPPIKLEADEAEGLVRGSAVFGSAYEGPPGCVHGGYIAAAFDEVLGLANSLSHSPGMTGRLTIHYRRPTPLHTELRFVARFDRQAGRKIFTSGELYAGDVLTAEGEGLFVSVDRSRFQQLFQERQAREAKRTQSAERDGSAGGGDADGGEPSA